MFRIRVVLCACAVLAAWLTHPMTARAQSMGSVVGSVVDSLGGLVPGASVTLVRDGQEITTTSSDRMGEFAFERVVEGRYQLEARASGFERRRSDPVYVGSGSR